MKKYYVDTDLRNNCYFVIPLIQDKKHNYAIRFENKHTADDFARRLNAALIKSPLEEIERFELIEVVENQLGKLHIYSPL